MNPTSKTSVSFPKFLISFALLFSVNARALVKCEGLCVYAERSSGSGRSNDMSAYGNNEGIARNSLSSQCSDICRVPDWRGCDLRGVQCNTLAQIFATENRTAFTLWIAVAYWNGKSWRTAGWWSLAPGQSTDLVTLYGVDHVKFLATTAPRGGGQDWVPKGISTVSLCIDGGNRFDRDMNDFNCNGGSLRMATFGEVKLNASGRTTQRLVP